MWSDNETTTDLLSIDHLTAAVESVVYNSRLLPVTVGVFGGWGSGKSSIIRMTEERLKKHEDVLCISFNGWLFENHEDAKAALMGTILDEVQDKRTLTSKGKDLVKRLSSRVDWFRTLSLIGRGAITISTGIPAIGLSDVKGLLEDGLLEGFSSEGIVNKLKSVDSDTLAKLFHAAPDESVRKTIREFHDDFAVLIEDTKLKSLVVFIDDLDRCLPDTVIATLEAIRLFLFVPRTAFVIGADEDLIHHAVETRFPNSKGVRPHVGRDYLEKLIQIPIRVPPLGPREIETYMALLFADLHLNDKFEEFLDDLRERSESQVRIDRLDRALAEEMLNPCPIDLSSDLLLVQQTSDVLATGLDGNPRQTKRFLNTLLLRTMMAKSRGVSLGRRVLAKLMLLEYFKTEAFRKLATLQGLQEGKPEELFSAEIKARGEASFATASNDDNAVVEGDNSSNEEQMDDLASWLKDDWLLGWLQSEPSLTQVDLRPYFYVSRDRLSLYSGPAARMTPAARSVLKHITSVSRAERINAAEEAKALSNIDAAAVFESLADRARRSENHRPEHSPYYGLILLAEKRGDLTEELLRFLTEISDELVPIGSVPKIVELFGTGNSVSMTRELIVRWSTSKHNTLLASAAQAVLPNLN